MNDAYPVGFSVDYPDRQLNRLTTGLRIFTVIPIAIVLLPPLLMIVFRQKYTRWWFDWNLEPLRFINRVGLYLALMDDRYPSTDERQAVRGPSVR